MDATSLVLSASSLAFSIAALLVSSLFAARQVRLMRHANQLPVFVELLKDLRTKEFQDHRDYVWHHLNEHDPALGVFGLPEPARTSARLVTLFYQNIAFLVNYGAIDRELVYRSLHYGITRTWESVRAYVYGERALRGNGSRYGEALELMAAETARFERRRPVRTGAARDQAESTVD